MQIPKLHYISQGKTPQEHLENIQQACVSGAPLVQLRLKNISVENVLKTAKEAREITNFYKVKLIINDFYKIAKQINADGVHLGKEDASPDIARIFLGDSFIIGGTANTAEDCATLLQKKVNYIGLGPFRFTKTKENLSPILGYEGYQSIIHQLKTTLPIIAIGGITVDDVPELLKTGIYGIATSGEITRDFNNTSLFNKLLDKPIKQL